MKTISTILLALIIGNSFAQPTYINTIPVGPSSVCINSLWKYQYITEASDSIVYLNADGSIYKVIKVTWPASPKFTTRFVLDFYQNLITTDGQVSYITVGYDSNDIEHSHIYKEDGTLLMAVDSADMRVNYVISGTEQVAGITVTHLSGLTEIYTVPGTFCISCTAAACSSSMSVANPVQGNASMELYPNPSNQPAMIKYSLPPGTNDGEIAIYSLSGQLVKRMRVTGASGILTEGVRQSGTYLYQLSTADGTVIKKQVFTQ